MKFHNFLYAIHLPTLLLEQTISNRDTKIVRVCGQSFAQHIHKICLLQKTNQWKWFGRNTPTIAKGQNRSRNPSIGINRPHPGNRQNETISNLKLVNVKIDTILAFAVYVLPRQSRNKQM